MVYSTCKIIQKYPQWSTGLKPQQLWSVYIFILFISTVNVFPVILSISVCLSFWLFVCLSVRLCTCLSAWRLKTTKTWKSISPKDKTRHFCSSNKRESNSHRWLFAAVDLDMLTLSLLQSGKVSIRNQMRTQTQISQSHVGNGPHLDRLTLQHLLIYKKRKEERREAKR